MLYEPGLIEAQKEDLPLEFHSTPIALELPGKVEQVGSVHTTPLLRVPPIPKSLCILSTEPARNVAAP